MAQDTRAKQANPVMDRPPETRMPRYDYQKNDSRSFSVTYPSAPAAKTDDKQERRNNARPMMCSATCQVY